MENTSQAPFKSLTSPYEIRILHLDPGGQNTPLAGWLEHTSLENQPQYEALSYEWGIQEKTTSINLRGGAILPITESLYDALKDLRQTAVPEVSRALWVDAVCINQQNIEEVQSQVSIMGSIYRRATRVITYIGPERDDSTIAVDFARQLCRHVESRSYRSMDGGNPNPALVDPALPPLSDSRWRAVKLLTLRTWVGILLHSSYTPVDQANQLLPGKPLLVRTRVSLKRRPTPHVRDNNNP